MAVEQFKFISPGIFLNEIDESAIPSLPERMGPLVIGRFPKGPGKRPVQVSSYKEFVSVFGNASPGNASGDIWRTGDMTAPTYAAYAVQAWLRNNSPCTVYRVMGENRSDADTAKATSQAGWKTTNAFGSAATGDLSTHGGAYGLFVMPNPDSFDGGPVKSHATLTITNAGECTAGNTISLVTQGGSTITITGHATTTAMTTTSGASSDGTFDASTVSGGSTNNAAQATAIAAAFDLHDDLTATASGAVVTITQNTGGVVSSPTITIADGSGGGDISASMTVANFHEGAASSAPAVTGTLAAIWYCNSGAVVLSGTARDGAQRQGAGVMIKGTNGQFTAKVLSAGTSVASPTVAKAATFNFDRDSNLFIRKVFNTNPTETNSTIVDNAKNYWLGETFESCLSSNENGLLKVTGSTPSSNDQLGFILALDGDGESGITWGNRIQEARAAQTGWFISQDTRGIVTASFDPLTDTEKLFKFHALDSGEHANRDYKISIQDIKVPTDNFNDYGSFTVCVRRGTDSDNVPEILERYSNCSLDPNSLRYLGRQIGDKYYTYNSSNKTLVEHGNFANRSKYVRVEMAPIVENGNATPYNPFGVYGPSVPTTFRLLSGSTVSTIANNAGTLVATYVAGSGSGRCIPDGAITAGHV